MVDRNKSIVNLQKCSFSTRNNEKYDNKSGASVTPQEMMAKITRFFPHFQILLKSRPYPVMMSPPIFKNRRRRVLSPCEKIAKNTKKSRKSGNRSSADKVHLGRWRFFFNFRLLFCAKCETLLSSSETQTKLASEFSARTPHTSLFSSCDARSFGFLDTSKIFRHAR